MGGGGERSYLLSLVTGEVGGGEGEDLHTLPPGAPEPSVLLLRPAALRTPCAPSHKRTRPETAAQPRQPATPSPRGCAHTHTHTHTHTHIHTHTHTHTRGIRTRTRVRIQTQICNDPVEVGGWSAVDTARVVRSIPVLPVFFVVVLVVNLNCILVSGSR